MIEFADGKRNLATALTESADRLNREIDKTAVEQRAVDSLPAGKEKRRRAKLVQMQRDFIGRRLVGIKRVAELTSK